MTRKYKRYVTINDSEGKSGVLFDDQVGPQYVPFPGFELTDLWELRMPGDQRSSADTVQRPYALCNEAGQVMFKVVLWPPISELRKFPDYAQKTFSNMGESELAKDAGDYAWHKTDTTEFICILEGEITCVLEKEEVTLRQGDFMVQRGTNHGWVNRGDVPCLIACTMISAK